MIHVQQLHPRCECHDCTQARSRMSGFGQYIQTRPSNEALAGYWIWKSGKKQHNSDCATSVAPAEVPGPSDCDAPEDAPSAFCPNRGDEYTGDHIISHGDVRKSINCGDSWHKTVNARMEGTDEKDKQ